MSTDLIALQSQELEFPTMIADTIGKLSNLPTFSGIEITQNLANEVIHIHANSGIIWIFLYAYLKNAERYEIEGPIFLSTELDPDQGLYIIKTDVSKILSAPEAEPDEAALAFPSLGEMPLRYLARVIRNVSSRFEMIHRAERPLSLELKIKL